MTGLASPFANRRGIPFYMASLLLLITFALLVFSVAMKSPTMDEQNHVARGLAYLRTGDLRLSQEHPPGVNAWEAWPLLLDPQIRLPLDSPSWANAEWYGFADQLLWRVNDRPQEMVFASRVPVMWLTLLLAALVCRWARELGGGGAGLIALALFSFDPNILAHGRLATTDLGVTCLAFAAMFVLWRAMRSAGRLTSPVSDWGQWALSGIVLGMAQAAKFSALALGPVIAVIAVRSRILGWHTSHSPAHGGGNPFLLDGPVRARGLVVLLSCLFCDQDTVADADLADGGHRHVGE